MKKFLMKQVGGYPPDPTLYVYELIIIIAMEIAGGLILILNV